MKIIYLITRSDVMGGASIHLLDLAAGSKASGHQVIIGVGNASPSMPSLFQERAAVMGLECHSIKSLVREIDPIKDIFCYLELRKFFEKARCRFSPCALFQSRNSWTLSG